MPPIKRSSKSRAKNAAKARQSASKAKHLLPPSPTLPDDPWTSAPNEPPDMPDASDVSESEAEDDIQAAKPRKMQKMAHSARCSSPAQPVNLEKLRDDILSSKQLFNPQFHSASCHPDTSSQNPAKSGSVTVEDVLDEGDSYPAQPIAHPQVGRKFFTFQTPEDDDFDSGDESGSEDEGGEVAGWEKERMFGWAVSEETEPETLLERFNRVLIQGQNAALAAAREREGGKKQVPKHYLKNHWKTKKRKIQKGKELMDRVGFPSVKEAFSRIEKKKIEERREAEVDQMVAEIDGPQTVKDKNIPEIETEERKVEDPGQMEPPEPSPIHSEQDRLKELLYQLREGHSGFFTDDSPNCGADQSLNQFNYKDFERLRKIQAELKVKVKDKNLDVVIRTRVLGMAGTLNLYLDSDLSYSWRQASVIVSRSQGHGVYHARAIRNWLHRYISDQKLPVHGYGAGGFSILQDEDFSMAIQFHLQERGKEGYIRAQDVVDFLSSQAMQLKLEDAGITRRSISLRTAQRWMHRMSWRFGKAKRGMYIDGHEREDVVAYRNAFIARWQEYEKRMALYDDNGNIVKLPEGFQLPEGQRGQAFRLILVTHDESTFYANDRRRTKWFHASDKPEPERKGEGQSIMVSDFLTMEWGRLVDGDEKARILFRAGKNRDGYFSSEDLLVQVDRAIDIFEGRTKRFSTGLFLFDNAPSHRRRAADALSARKMPKGPSETWRHCKDGPRMRPGIFKSEVQDFYYPDDHPTMPGWFKGMQVILEERGLYRSGLLAQCPGFKCEAGSIDCCCRRILFNQPDFTNQKSQLEEYIEARGHICDFYPKYHCELNFIEQYWGAAKRTYRISPKTDTIEAMEQNVIASLDRVEHGQIIRFANRSARFIDAYRQGLEGAMALWANQKYHGHRTLPPEIVQQAFLAHKK